MQYMKNEKAKMTIRILKCLEEKRLEDVKLGDSIYNIDIVHKILLTIVTSISKQ